VGPRRPRNPEVVVAQSPKLRSSNSSDARGIGQQRERDGMRCDLNDRKAHSAGGN
jgi:hypothetical protein